MRQRVAIWKQLVICVVLVGGAAALWLWQDVARDWLSYPALAEPDRTSERLAGVPVIVAPVSTARDDLVLEAVGTGRAQRSVMLRSEAEGKVVELALAPGRRFKRGDVLLRLDDRKQRLALELATTRLAEAERRLARYKRLEGTGAAAAVTLDETETAKEIARIEVERAREALDDRSLRAPFGGVAGLAAIEVGDWIDTDDEVASLDDRSLLLVEFDLPEALISRVEPGMPATATTPAFPGRTFEGSVVAIDSRVEAASRTIRIRAAIPNMDDQLRPGASFTIRLELPGAIYPLVPELAVQFSRGSLYVWRVSDGTAEKVDVALVRRRGGSVLVEGALDEGDAIVVEGTQRLTPGKPVEVMGGMPGETT